MWYNESTFLDIFLRVLLYGSRALRSVKRSAQSITYIDILGYILTIYT